MQLPVIVKFHQVQLCLFTCCIFVVVPCAHLNSLSVISADLCNLQHLRLWSMTRRLITSISLLAGCNYSKRYDLNICCRASFIFTWGLREMSIKLGLHTHCAEKSRNKWKHLCTCTMSSSVNTIYYQSLVLVMGTAQITASWLTGKKKTTLSGMKASLSLFTRVLSCCALRSASRICNLFITCSTSKCTSCCSSYLKLPWRS